MNAKMKAMLSKFADAVDGFFAYIMTLAGVILSPIMPLIKSGKAIAFRDLHFSWFGFIISVLMAIVVTGIAESRGQSDGTPEQQSSAKNAKRRNFWVRMAVAFSVGAGWGQLV